MDDKEYFLMAVIPFEEQNNLEGQRTCGAAALNMVYKSFGITLPQAAIWRVISLPDAYGGRFARTYRIAFDALLRGVCAVAFKARDPIRAVQMILASGNRVIMNHRLTADTGVGHYTVALAADEDKIIFHDPQFGSAQEKPTSLMRELWQLKFTPCEITGNFLIALARNAPSSYTCNKCGVLCPVSVTCPACYLTIPLQPSTALGCWSKTCDSRLWQSLLCPFCDTIFPVG
jgi:hypothetical protein